MLFQRLTPPLLSAAFLALGIIFSVPIVSTMGCVLGVVWMSHALGATVAQTPSRIHRLILGLIPALSLLMITGGTVYYLTLVTPTTLAIAFGIALLATYLLASHFILRSSSVAQSEGGLPNPISQIPSPLPWSSRLALWFLLLGVGIFLLSLASHATTEASRSPWLEISPLFLGWLVIGIAGLLWAGKRTSSSTLFAGVAPLLFAAISIAALLYPIGYGFDPFLHRSTVEHILANGTITPKPAYYVGQYALELFASTFTPLSLHLIDVWLLPLLAALTLPAIFSLATKKLHAGWLLLLPLAPFIVTTPYGMAFLWWLAILGFTMKDNETVPSLLLLLVAGATLFLHPLIGIPTFWFCLLYTIQKHISNRVRPWLMLAWTTLGCTLLPLAFAVFAKGIDWHWPKLHTLFHSAPTWQSATFGDASAFLIWATVLIIIASAFFYAWKNRKETWVQLHVVASVLFLGNALLLASTQRFGFVISYEQNDYLQRLLALSGASLTPMGIAGISIAFSRLQQHHSKMVRLALYTSASFFLMAHVYGAYPRHDAYQESRGFTVSKTDQDTVLAIAQHAGTTPYIVLANQSVSAAAVEAFGFKPFYGQNGDVYFYPIPTSGPLYNHFLTMIEKSVTKEEALAAMQLAGVKQLYFVVNDYWWSAPKALESAREVAATWFTVGKSTVFVFSVE